MAFRTIVFVMLLTTASLAQMPPVEPGVSQELAKWRAVRYSDVRYKLNLTLEKMSPVLKGTMEIRLSYAAEACAECPPRFIVLDWRKIRGHEEKSTISNVSINGKPLSKSDAFTRSNAGTPKGGTLTFQEHNEHLIFNDGVEMGENVIKLDFTSPILPSGSAITRYVDKEDGSEYLYSLFVPSDASTAFPVFDQPDIKARFGLFLSVPDGWKVASNTDGKFIDDTVFIGSYSRTWKGFNFEDTKPISTYVFAFAAGPWEKVDRTGGNLSGSEGAPLPRDTSGQQGTLPIGRVSASGSDGSVYIRKSQATKFKPHAAEVFRLNREAIKYFEQYFDYKFPFPKYDLVLIPEFPFGGMEHAGATFLRESAVIFPQEPTKNDHISRATLIFHEAAHQWFGDTVTMRWFDDLWLKEGFATFTAYKALEKIMPEANAWKVFYERIKQGAYQTDSTKGTTPIYQEIKNLSAAKSAYGNIVYNKAPAFLRQAEFYLGEDKFQTAVRAFLMKHEFGNAGWEDLVKEFEIAGAKDLSDFAQNWVKRRGLPLFRIHRSSLKDRDFDLRHIAQENRFDDGTFWTQRVKILSIESSGSNKIRTIAFERANPNVSQLPIAITEWTFHSSMISPLAVMPNYQDYGYGIFLLDDKSRDYVLKNIQNEKDPFLRSMMWGALWDSVREGELDPREYVELVVRVLSKSDAFTRSNPGTAEAVTLTETPKGVTLTEDESTTALLLSRVGTAMNYYLSEPPAVAGGSVRWTEPKGNVQPAATAEGSDKLAERVEGLLIAGMQNSPTLGQRITYYRAFLNIASSGKARNVLKAMLKGGNPSGSEGAPGQSSPAAGTGQRDAGRSSQAIPLKTKDKFDIVTRLLILNDSDAPKLLAELEKAETGDDAKRYAYAARAGIASGENKAKYWNDFVNDKGISESWIEAAFGPWNSIRHSSLTLPYLQKALQELPNHKRNRKIFFVNGWLGAFIGGQRSKEALAVVNKFLADNPTLDSDLRLKILENVDVVERAIKIRQAFASR